MCRKQLIAPIASDTETLDIVFVAPNEMPIIDEIQLLTGLRVRPSMAPFGSWKDCGHPVWIRTDGQCVHRRHGRV